MDKIIIDKSVQFLKTKFHQSPQIGLILGSGLGVLAEEIENPINIAYNDIPEFPVSTVEGHAGQLVFGTLNGKQLWQCKDDFTSMKDIAWKK